EIHLPRGLRLVPLLLTLFQVGDDEEDACTQSRFLVGRRERRSIPRGLGLDEVAACELRLAEEVVAEGVVGVELDGLLVRRDCPHEVARRVLRVPVLAGLPVLRASGRGLRGVGVPLLLAARSERGRGEQAEGRDEKKGRTEASEAAPHHRIPAYQRGRALRQGVLRCQNGPMVTLPLPRTLEPEVMDTEEEARDYDAMDHAQVNARFCDDLLATGARLGRVLDVGTGTALIPIELCRRDPRGEGAAIDLASHMLALAERNVARAELGRRIRVARMDAKATPWADGAFDAVM